jgi:hypothetical protein
MPAAPANPFQQLASDIQAMLIQAQGSTTAQTAATATPTTASGATADSTGQNLATNLQTLMNDLQSGGTPNAQTASTNPADPVNQTGHHHHHHHHEDDGNASGATAVAGSSPPAGATATTSDDHAVSQLFAADIAQAIRSYGGVSASSMMPALTV